MYYILLHSQSCHKSLISIKRYYSRLFVLEFKAPSIVQVQQSHYILSVRFLLILKLLFFICSFTPWFIANRTYPYQV